MIMKKEEEKEEKERKKRKKMKKQSCFTKFLPSNMDKKLKLTPKSETKKSRLSFLSRKSVPRVKL